MKVSGSSGVGPAQTAQPRGGGAPAAAGFALGGAAEATAASRVGPASVVGSLDALLMLQEVGGPTERRRKAVRRAGVILDVLDDLKIAVLDGAVAPSTLRRLMDAVRQERALTGDERLEGVLDEIETRAAVELAKLDQ
ncbi:MAG TPA: flagellar assembly protein FliX [Caulobacteraceae bacterium]|nr:flagellar assembly protein FliX [Caulobacteraceae bacterium]